MVFRLSVILLAGLSGCPKAAKPAPGITSRSASSPPTSQGAADSSPPVKKDELRAVPIFLDGEPSALRATWRPVTLRKPSGKTKAWVAYLSVEYTLTGARELAAFVPSQLPRDTQRVLLLRVKDTSNRTLLWVTLELTIGRSKHTVDVVDEEHRHPAGRYGYIMLGDIGLTQGEIDVSAEVVKCVHK